jgi:Ni,Fe-hydrogenase III small subunit/ferredoxin
MYAILKSRIKQGCRTMDFPVAVESMPDRFRGLPHINEQSCKQRCKQCVEVCPVEAISKKKTIDIDLGRCTFCGQCQIVCPEKKIEFTRDYRLATRQREALILPEHRPQVEALQGEMKKLFGRSLKLRQVSAGGCNGCEVDTNVLATLAFDLGRFGIQIVASPRHADGLLVTGPVSHNMYTALQKTYDAVPSPKLVIATGACAISGGIFRDHEQVHNGVEGILPVDLYIPGCPPHPWTILDGLVRLMGRM